PSKGSPRNFGVIFSSKSATALDYIAAKMMGFKPQNVPIIDKSLKIDQLDASTITVDNIWQNFVFEKVDLVKVQRSRGILILMPSFIKNIFREYFDFYPAFKDSCKKCNICVDSCPIDVITLTKDDKKPSIDYSKCIKCLCCHEMCPYDAVYIKKTMLAKLFMK
ncbi:MAG: 4Fe-4S binding protein, partial [Candidatus Cloacimonadota bacterium]|nr:4Fe-4S binding protein [Candidatus Cloacimonadota bacterium]